MNRLVEGVRSVVSVGGDVLAEVLRRGHGGQMVSRGIVDGLVRPIRLVPWKVRHGNDGSSSLRREEGLMMRGRR